jgi:hypothetical protein
LYENMVIEGMPSSFKNGVIPGFLRVPIERTGCGLEFKSHRLR